LRINPRFCWIGCARIQVVFDRSESGQNQFFDNLDGKLHPSQFLQQRLGLRKAVFCKETNKFCFRRGGRLSGKQNSCSKSIKTTSTTTTANSPIGPITGVRLFFTTVKILSVPLTILTLVGSVFWTPSTDAETLPRSATIEPTLVNAEFSGPEGPF
jgi:hypothetical protein